eukprot:TRINITY_DN26810_c0_g1_i1.p1 TRINITY_DN26810_c0_g1~~TRINITY_DN26810_c0_g1_i1.p1  ORF type:complete len:196 (+),score=12.56 TRINITY_DN26810_c0_g1_i1:272-859(+)
MPFSRGLAVVLSVMIACLQGTHANDHMARDFDFWVGEFSKLHLSPLPIAGVKHSAVKVWCRHEGGLRQQDLPRYAHEWVRWGTVLYEFPVVKVPGQGPEVGNLMQSVGAIEDGKPCLRTDYANVSPSRFTEAREVVEGQYMVLTYHRGSTRGRIEGNPDVHIVCNDRHVKKHGGKCLYVSKATHIGDDEVLPFEL